MDGADPLSSAISLLQTAPIGVLYKSLDGGILGANTAFCQLIGYSEAQLRRLDGRSLTTPEEFAQELHIIRQLCSGCLHQHTFQQRLLCGDGSLVQTEVTLSLIGDFEADSGYLLAFVVNLSDRQRSEQELQQRREREALLSDIAAVIRTTLDLPTILNLATQRLKQALNADRVLAYQILPDQSGICVAEAVNPPYLEMQGQGFPAACIPPPYLEAYRLGRLWSVSNVDSEELADCHREMLHQIQVRSMIAVAVQRADAALQPQHRTLWGLLVIHQCRTPRPWTAEEENLVQAVANQVAIALEQATFIQQLQSYTEELEERVQERTHSLEQSLRFEQLVHRLTETLRTGLDEDQMLDTAVEGLVTTLGVEGCYASLYQEPQALFQVRHQHLHPRSRCRVGTTLIGQTLQLQDWSPACRHRFLLGKTIVRQLDLQAVPSASQPALATCVLPSTAVGTQVVEIVCPISDDQGLLGAVSVFDQAQRHFSAAEIHLIEQVAKQCAIAIRQARLYREEHQQRISADYFRLFLEKSTDVFVEYDQDLRYLSINPAGCLFLNRPLTDIVGKTNSDLLGTAGETLEQPLRQAFNTKSPVFFNHEVSLPHRSCIFETIYTPIPDPDGQVRRVIGICRDISEFRDQWQLLETQNHQLAATTRLKEEFIATTSHELRTPLTAILGFSNVLLQEFFGPLNEKQKEYIDRIHHSGQHLLALINDILDLSRIEADRLELEPQVVFIADIYESVLSLIGERAAEQGLQLDVEVEPGLDFVIADPRRLKQMLLNLLTNAVKFTPTGTVGLKIYRGTAGSLGLPRPLVHFEVWDTGIGISPADQELLFSPFSQIDSSLTRRHQGTGLGLVITRKLAELHGGSIKLESTPANGSRFTISLPLYTTPEEMLITKVREMP